MPVSPKPKDAFQVPMCIEGLSAHIRCQVTRYCVVPEVVPFLYDQRPGFWAYHVGAHGIGVIGEVEDPIVKDVCLYQPRQIIKTAKVKAGMTFDHVGPT